MRWEGHLGSEEEQKERNMTVQRQRHRVKVTLRMLLGVLLVSGVVAPPPPISKTSPSPSPAVQQPNPNRDSNVEATSAVASAAVTSTPPSPIQGSCGVRGSLDPSLGKATYEVGSGTGTWSKVVSVLPHTVAEKDSAGSDVGQPNAALGREFAHSLDSSTLGQDPWTVAGSVEVLATNPSVNPTNERFQQTDGNLRLLKVSFARSMVKDSGSGTTIATMTIDHYLFLNSGMWVDQTHGQQIPVSCGVFLHSIKVDDWPFCGRDSSGQEACGGRNGCNIQLQMLLDGAASWSLRPQMSPYRSDYRFASTANANNLMVLSSAYSQAYEGGTWETKGLPSGDCNCNACTTDIPEPEPQCSGLEQSVCSAMSGCKYMNQCGCIAQTCSCNSCGGKKKFKVIPPSFVVNADTNNRAKVMKLNKHKKVYSDTALNIWFQIPPGIVYQAYYLQCPDADVAETSDAAMTVEFNKPAYVYIFRDIRGTGIGTNTGTIPKFLADDFTLQDWQMETSEATLTFAVYKSNVAYASSFTVPGNAQAPAAGHVRSYSVVFVAEEDDGIDMSAVDLDYCDATAGPCSCCGVGKTASGVDCDCFAPILSRTGDQDVLTVRMPHQGGYSSYRYQGYTMISSPHSDQDGDGISDDDEGFEDVDGDGIPNLVDLDSDGDGLLDQLEKDKHSDDDGVPNFLDLDSDNDGIPDSYECRMLAGLTSVPNEENGGIALAAASGQTLALCDPWVPPAYPTDAVCSKQNSTDRMYSWFVAGDTDKDGLIDCLDLDSDNDGIPDTEEWNEPAGRDVDGDGVDNYLDLDSDNDGIRDNTEGQTDPDGDGIPSYVDVDSDGDGINDVTEEYWEEKMGKNPSIKHYLDEDSDHDTIPDRVETTADADRDGIPNFLDLDSDGDALLDSIELLTDTDGDNITAFLDLDSDGDGILDSEERDGDPDQDGIPNYLDIDSDGDGMPDSFEYKLAVRLGMGNFRDRDGDGFPNWYDVDSDNDTVKDSLEGYPYYAEECAPSIDCSAINVQDTCESAIGCRYSLTCGCIKATCNCGDASCPSSGITARRFANTKEERCKINTNEQGIPAYLDCAFPVSTACARESGEVIDDDVCVSRCEPPEKEPEQPPAPPLDSDNDGIYDVEEGTEDTDGDGIPNYLDTDSDNDGILDAMEGGRIVKYNCTPPTGSDVNCRGLNRGQCEEAAEPGRVLASLLVFQNCRWWSSCGCMLKTATDCNTAVVVNTSVCPPMYDQRFTDTDNDGIPDYKDRDSDGDGIDDLYEGYSDPDKDGIPSYRDLDSDNDGVTDASEGAGKDKNRNGVPDFLDDEVAEPTTYGGADWGSAGPGTGIVELRCGDTVANGRGNCQDPLSKDCWPGVRRFHGAVGDTYTILCPPLCALDTMAVYGPFRTAGWTGADGCSAFPDHGTFLDHSSICKSLYSMGQIEYGRAGLGRIRLVPPVESYPSCNSMPRARQDYLQTVNCLGKVEATCNADSMCKWCAEGCMPGVCACGDFGCLARQRPVDIRKISSLQSVSGNSYSTQLLIPGAVLYTDRTDANATSKIPAIVYGRPLISTPDADKGVTGNALSFMASEDSIVYVLRQEKGDSAVPAWLSRNYTRVVGAKVESNNQDVGSFQVWKGSAILKAGVVTEIEGANAAGSSGANTANHLFVVGPGTGATEYMATSASGVRAAIDTSSPKFSTLNATWSAWGRVTDRIGANCCNDTIVPNQTSVTPLGGGCCDIQRYRQRYVPGFWIGVRAFEVVPLSRNLSYVPVKSPPKNESEPCLDRCQDPVPLDVVVSDKVLETGVEATSQKAQFCLKLKSQPLTDVLVTALMRVYQLNYTSGTAGSYVRNQTVSKFQTQPVITVTFTRTNWNVKQCVLLIGVLDTNQTVDYYSPVSLKVWSNTPGYNQISVPDMQILIRQKRCPFLPAKDSYISLKSCTPVKPRSCANLSKLECVDTQGRCNFHETCGCIPSGCTCKYQNDTVSGAKDPNDILRGQCVKIPKKTVCIQNPQCRMSTSCGCIPKECSCGDDKCIYNQGSLNRRRQEEEVVHVEEEDNDEDEGGDEDEDWDGGGDDDEDEHSGRRNTYTVTSIWDSYFGRMKPKAAPPTRRSSVQATRDAVLLTSFPKLYADSGPPTRYTSGKAGRRQASSIAYSKAGTADPSDSCACRNIAKKRTCVSKPYCRMSTACGCIPKTCVCGDDSCVYGTTVTLVSGQSMKWCGKRDSTVEKQQDTERSKAEVAQDKNNEDDELQKNAALKAAELACHNEEEVNNALGSVCTFQCQAGMFPADPVSITCNSISGAWSPPLPNCTDCAAGYYQSGSACIRCSTDTACAVGQYRGACGSNEDAPCIPCSGKPPGSLYTSPGTNPPTSNNCEWKCEGLGVTSYFSGGQCLPCSTSICPAGQYRSSCDPATGAMCKPCTNPGPANSAYVGGGTPFDQNNCAVACGSGFYDPGNNTCITDPGYGVIIGSQDLEASEAAGNTASFDVKLTRAPAAGQIVTVVLSTGSQLSPTSITLTFTDADWGTAQLVTYTAVDDSLYEGGHGEAVHITTTSGDSNYHMIPVADVPITIVDNDCAPVVRPRDATLSNPCSTIAGGTCTVTCNAGHAPATPELLTCTAATLLWDKTPPACDTCLGGYFKDGNSQCRNCTTCPCPAGEYRKPCTATHDSVCLPCTNVIPSNAFYSATSTSGAAGCPWACKQGYTLYDGTCQAFPSSVEIIVSDRDGFITTEGAVAVNGGSQTLACASVRLSDIPVGGDVMVHFLLNDGQLRYRNVQNLTFTADNWMIKQSFCVEAVDDSDVEGRHGGTIAFNVTSPDPRYNSLKPGPLGVTIKDNDCAPLIAPPNSQLSSSCGSTYGTNCSVLCTGNHAPVLPQVFTCLSSTGTWSGVPEECDTCASNFFKDSQACSPCTTGACPVGNFRLPCSDTGDSTCAACTGKPDYAHYTTAGTPEELNNCDWFCDTNFYRDGSMCRLCTAGPCPVGFYRGLCTQNSDGRCIACTNTIDANAEYTSAGNPATQNNCKASCKTGFYWDGATCVAVPPAVPNVLVTNKVLTTSEAAGATPASFKLTLSSSPAADVVLTLTVDSQLNTPSVVTVTLTASNWNSGVSVSVPAKPDDVNEGLHSGDVTVTLTSGAAQGPLPTITINIQDDDCPPLIVPSDASLIGTCVNEASNGCQIRCDRGYEPSGEQWMVCNPDTLTWDGTLSSCSLCAQNYFRSQTTSKCEACSNSTCPVGQFQGPCTDTKDSSCIPCTGLPPNAKYASAGIPYNADACIWLCSKGFWRDVTLSTTPTGGECTPCTTAPCPIGFTRSPCLSSADAECIPCNNTKPTEARWTSPGPTCAWECNAPYKYDKPLGTCVLPDGAQLLITDRQLQTSETTGSTPASWNVTLSQQPLAVVNVTFTALSQLETCTPSKLRFTAENWDVKQNVTCNAIDDDVTEGDHFGTVSIGVASHDYRYGGGLKPLPLVVSISEDKCPIVTLPPHASLDGIGCVKPYHGTTCEISCNQGYHAAPQGPQEVESRDTVLVGDARTLLTCQTSDEWNARPPDCSQCSEGYYKVAGEVCVACSDAQCPIGFYRGPCGETSDGACVPCAVRAKPAADSYYISAGDPYYANNCEWQCNSGLVYDEAGQTCVAPHVPAPRIIIGPSQPLAHVHETIGTLPPVTVSFSLPADTPPTATVIVNVTLSMQLNAARSRRQAVQNRVVLLTFTTANYQTAQNIVVDAWDDRLVEGGTHLGVLQFKVISTDLNYKGLVVPMVGINIEDNDCSALVIRGNAELSAPCSNDNAYGSTCNLKCWEGYTGSPNTSTVTCSATSRMFEGRMPNCTECASGWWSPQKGICLPCSNAACPVGQYRGKCEANADAQCVLCSTRPAFSRYTTAGIPYNKDTCGWECEEGFKIGTVNTTYRDGSESIVRNTTVCVQIPGDVYVPPPPPDTDGDGIYDIIEGQDLDTDLDGIPDYLDLDSDNDGIPDAIEQAGDNDRDGISNYRDLDSDGDAIPDEIEGAMDKDGDGLPNFLDLDSDWDGILDSQEGYDDADGDGVPNFLDLDSDGDGILDSIELLHDPDGDGIPAFLDLDSDGDSLLDELEGSIDSDKDGWPDFLDKDSDNDSIPDVIEGAKDSDNDGKENFRDPDSDGDGISDLIEGTVDTDNDGIPDRLDQDTDGDGIPDKTEGVPDWRVPAAPVEPKVPLDTDGDGIPDSIEGEGDADGDGIPNYLDLDSDGDGIPDSIELLGDPDEDGVPNFLDTDSDGDGIGDEIEGTGDADNDGLPNYLDKDSDGDGILDSIECECTDRCGVRRVTLPSTRRSLSPTTNNQASEVILDRPCTPEDRLTPDDRDGDGVPNYLDLDSDNDLIPDSTEGTRDDDGNGIPNYLDPFQPDDNRRGSTISDADGDGIPDDEEGSWDRDGDGIPNYLDLDSDGDGALDSVEGTGDTDADGIPNFLDIEQDDEQPVTCRAPGCRLLRDTFLDPALVAVRPLGGNDAVILVVVLILLPLLMLCCGFLCGSFCGSEPPRCSHCDLECVECVKGRLSVSLWEDREWKADDWNWRQEFRREIAAAMGIRIEMVSVGPLIHAETHFHHQSYIIAPLQFITFAEAWNIEVRRKKFHPQIALPGSHPELSGSSEVVPTSGDDYKDDNVDSTRTMRSSVPSELTADLEQSHTKSREVHRTWSLSVEERARQIDVHDHERLVRKRDYMNNERLERLFTSSHGGLYDRYWNDDAVEVTPYGWRRRPDSEVIQPAASIRRGSAESMKKKVSSDAVMGDNDGDRDKQMMAGENFGAVNEEERPFDPASSSADNHKESSSSEGSDSEEWKKWTREDMTIYFNKLFKDKHSAMMTFEGHCKQIQSLETETTDRYTTVCEKCELPYKDCDCHCPICCLPLTACHVDCRVDDEMPQDQPQAVTVIHPKTAQLPSVDETPRTLGTLGFSPVDVIDVEKKRAFFLTKAESDADVDAGLVFQDVQDHSLTNANYQQPVQLLSTSPVVQQSVVQQSEVNIVNNTTIYQVPTLRVLQDNVKAPPRTSGLVGPPSLKQGALHMCAMVGLDVSEKPPWEVVGRRELMPAGQKVLSDVDFTRMPRGGDVIISVEGTVIAGVESSAEVRDMLTGDSGQVKTVVVSRLGKILEFRLLCNCSYPAIQFLRGPPHVVAAVGRLEDENGTLQGSEGCVNPVVKPGDGLLSVDGQPVDKMHARQLRTILFGRTGTTTAMEFSRASKSENEAAGATYRVYARRNELNCLQSWTMLQPAPNPSAPTHRDIVFEPVQNSEQIYVSPPPVKRPDIPLRSGMSLPTVRSASPLHPVMPLDAPRAGLGLILFISNESRNPVVTDVTDLVDQHGVSQGRPGYANTAVSPGDTLMSVDRRDLMGCSRDEIEEMLNGNAMSPVRLTLLGARGLYTVVCLRRGQVVFADDAPYFTSKDDGLSSDLSEDEGHQYLGSSQDLDLGVASNSPPPPAVNPAVVTSSMPRVLASQPLKSSTSQLSQVADPVMLASKPVITPFLEERRAAIKDEPIKEAHVGIDITDSHPHSVIMVRDLMDANGRLQGEPGYSNKEVLPGDVIVSIDKIGVEHEDIGFLHRQIRGERLTVVEIGLRRGNDQFCIFVLRHAFHEFDQASRAPAAHGVVRAKNCHVGFDVTDDAPHRVCQIGEVMDIYGKLQGDSQYSNREILEGDTVVGIDGVDVRGNDVGYIHSALWGDSMTAVSITLVRRNRAFTIQVLRHAHYQLDRNFASMSSNHSSAEEENGSVGLEVTLSHPHEVMEVRDLLGLNGKLQGEPGYSNPAVTAGDTLYAINGRYCEHQDMGFLHQALRGPRLTAVSLTFRRAGTGEKYNIRVLRHKPHEFEKSKAKKMHMSMA